MGYAVMTPSVHLGIGRLPKIPAATALLLSLSLGATPILAQPAVSTPSATPPAAPTDVNDAARRDAAAAFEQGQHAFAGSDFAAAAEYFETADRLLPASPAVVQAIRAHRGVHALPHDARAATLAVRLLTRYADDPRVTTYATRVIDELSPTLGRLRVNCQSCELSIDQTASDTNVFVEPGRHNLVALWGSRTASREVEVSAGGTQNVELTPPPPEGSAAALDPYGMTPAHTPTPTPTPTPGPRTTAPTGPQGTSGRTDPPLPPPVDAPRGSGLPPGVFVVGTVVTLGLGGALVWSALNTLSGRDQYVMNPTQTALDDGRSREFRTNLLIGATAAVGATTLLIGAFFTRWRSSSVQASPSVQAINGAAPGLTVLGSF